MVGSSLGDEEKYGAFFRQRIGKKTTESLMEEAESQISELKEKTTQ